MNKHQKAGEMTMRCGNCDVLTFFPEVDVNCSEDESSWYVLFSCPNCGSEWMIKGKSEDLGIANE
jgi:hypothetical protein